MKLLIFFLVTFPFDITKTRLQIQGERASMVESNKPIVYRGMVETATGIGQYYHYVHNYMPNSSKLACLKKIFCQSIKGVPPDD